MKCFVPWANILDLNWTNIETNKIQIFLILTLSAQVGTKFQHKLEYTRWLEEGGGWVLIT